MAPHSPSFYLRDMHIANIPVLSIFNDLIPDWSAERLPITAILVFGSIV